MEKKYLIEPLRERCYFICCGQFISYFDSRLLVLDSSEMCLDDSTDCIEPIIYNVTEGGSVIRQEEFFQNDDNINRTFNAFDFSNNPELRKKVLKVAFSSCVEEESKKEEPVSYWVSKTMYELGRIGIVDACNFKEELAIYIQEMVAADSYLQEFVKVE